MISTPFLSKIRWKLEWASKKSFFVCFVVHYSGAKLWFLVIASYELVILYNLWFYLCYYGSKGTQSRVHGRISLPDPASPTLSVQQKLVRSWRALKNMLLSLKMFLYSLLLNTFQSISNLSTLLFLWSVFLRKGNVPHKHNIPIINVGSILLVLWGQKLGPSFCPHKTSSMLPTFMIGMSIRRRRNKLYSGRRVLMS